MKRYAPGALPSKLVLHIGRPCPYCLRTMGDNDVGLQPTRDHFPIPKSRNGTRTIICCYDCNHIKGDKSADDWAAYRAANPEWWVVRPKPIVGRKPRAPRRIVQPETPSQPLRAALEAAQMSEQQRRHLRMISLGFEHRFGASRRGRPR